MLDSLKFVITKLNPSLSSSWAELVIIIFNHPTQPPDHPAKSKTARIQYNIAFKTKVVHIDLVTTANYVEKMKKLLYVNSLFFFRLECKVNNGFHYKRLVSVF